MKLVFYTDDEDVISLIKDNSSFEDVQFIENIDEVDSFLDENVPLLIILDFDSNKKECEKLLKNIHEFEDAHSVVVSSEMKIKNFKKHQKSKYGADGYLRKPLSQIDLTQVYDDFCLSIESNNSEGDIEHTGDVEFSSTNTKEEIDEESSSTLDEGIDETPDIIEDDSTELENVNEHIEFESSELDFDLDSSTEQNIGETMSNDEPNDKDSSIDTDPGLDLETDSSLDIDTSIDLESSFDEESLNIDDDVNVSTDTSIDKNINLNLGEEADAGMDLNLGEEADSGMDLNLGEEEDSGMDLNLGEEADAPIEEEASSVLEFDGVEMSEIGEKDISEVKEIDVEVDELQAALDVSSESNEEFEGIEMSDIAGKDISEVKEIEVEVDELKEVLETTSSDAVTQDAEMLSPTMMTEDETGDMDISILSEEEDSLEDNMSSSEEHIIDDLPEDNNQEEQIVAESSEQVVIGQERVLPAQINEDELVRLQATIRHLREERESLLKQNEELESDQQRLSQQNLGHISEIDDLKIELSIQKKRFDKEVDFLKEKLLMSEEKKSVYEEKIKRSRKEIDLLGQKVRVDLNKIKERETELESQLELQTMDYESQIVTRDKKLLELKRKIDSLEFNMENASIKEQQSRDNQLKVEERLRAVMKTLRGSLEMIEDDLDDEGCIIKKIGRIG